MTERIAANVFIGVMVTAIMAFIIMIGNVFVKTNTFVDSCEGRGGVTVKRVMKDLGDHFMCVKLEEVKL